MYMYMYMYIYMYVYVYIYIYIYMYNRPFPGWGNHPTSAEQKAWNQTELLET